MMTEWNMMPNSKTRKASIFRGKETAISGTNAELSLNVDFCS
jgi:hypothetical protein